MNDKAPIYVDDDPRNAIVLTLEPGQEPVSFYTLTRDQIGKKPASLGKVYINLGVAIAAIFVVVIMIVAACFVLAPQQFC